MEVTFRKNLSKSYMCIEEQGQLVEPYELQMLENRIIPGLLQMETVISEGKRRYLYDISGKQQIGDFYSGKKIGYEILQLFLFSVRKVCTGLSEYLLRESGICLEMEFIYVSLEDGSLQFTYLPFCDQNLPEAFEACMEQLLRKLDHQDKAAVELGYQVYQLCAGGNVNIGKLLETALGKPLFFEEEELSKEAVDGLWESREIEDNKGTAENDSIDKVITLGNAADIKASKGLWKDKKIWQDKLDRARMQAAQAARRYLPGFTGKFAQIYEVIGENRNQKVQKTSVFSGKVRRKNRKAAVIERLQEERKVFEEVQGGGIFYTEKEDLPAHPTEILGVRQKEPLGKLTYQGVHQCESIQIEGKSFLLGKNSEQADGVIWAEGVSRLHARVTRQENKFFIEDLNSTNGTYLNDVALDYHQPQELKPGDRIRLGVEEYQFS